MIPDTRRLVPVRRYASTFFQTGDVPETRVEELVDAALALTTTTTTTTTDDSTVFSRLLGAARVFDPNENIAWIRAPGHTVVVSNPHVVCCALDPGQLQRLRQSAAFGASESSMSDLAAEPLSRWMSGWSVGVVDFPYETYESIVALRTMMIRGEVLAGHLLLICVPSERLVMLAALCGSSYNDVYEKRMVQRVRILACACHPIPFPFDTACETIEKCLSDGLYIPRFVDAVLGHRLDAVRDTETTRRVDVVSRLLRIARYMGGHGVLRDLEDPTCFLPASVTRSVPSGSSCWTLSPPYRHTYT
jgi:hypothetical protein